MLRFFLCVAYMLWIKVKSSFIGRSRLFVYYVCWTVVDALLSKVAHIFLAKASAHNISIVLHVRVTCLLQKPAHTGDATYYMYVWHVCSESQRTQGVFAFDILHVSSISYRTPSSFLQLYTDSVAAWRNSFCTSLSFVGGARSVTHLKWDMP